MGRLAREAKWMQATVHLRPEVSSGAPSTNSLRKQECDLQNSSSASLEGALEQGGLGLWGEKVMPADQSEAWGGIKSQTLWLSY